MTPWSSPCQGMLRFCKMENAVLMEGVAFCRSESRRSSEEKREKRVVRSRSRSQMKVIPAADAYTVPEGVEVPKVAGARSKKPTMASQWRKQKERDRLREQQMADRLASFNAWPCVDQV